jgi:hypothetical protein
MNSQELIEEIKLLKEKNENLINELNQTKEHLKKYTSPIRNKNYYEENKEKHKQVVKEYVPFVHDVGKIAMKKELPKVANEALAVLTHIVNPFDVLDAHGLSLKDLFEPLLADEKITKLMQPRWLSEIKALVEENNKEKFVNWLFSYPKKQIFGKETDSLAIALQKVVRQGKLLKVEAPRIFQKYKALPIMSKFKETIKDYKMPAKNSEFKIPTSSMRSRSLRGPATRSQARARTRKNRL